MTYLFFGRRHSSVPALIALTLWGLIAINPTSAADWTSFRNGGSSVATGDYPLNWSPDSGVAWQIETSGYGQSSPIIWQDRVYLTAVRGDQKEECLVLCHDLKTGEAIWAHAAKASSTAPSTYQMSRAAPTPVVDESGIYAFFESGDLLGLSHDGERLWSRSLTQEYGPFENRHGLGSSLAQNELSVFAIIEHAGASYLLAVDKISGANRWKVDRPSRTSWTSPIVAGSGDDQQVIVSSNGSVSAYHAASGKLLWTFDQDISGNTVPSPVFTGDRLIVGARTSEFGSSARAAESNLCLKLPTETGEPATIDWRARKAVCHYASPVICAGCVYFLNDGGILYCLDLETGEQVYVKRIHTSCWTTPIVVDDRLYFFGKDGTATILQGGKTFKELASNRLWAAENPPVPETYQEAKQEEHQGGEGGRPGGRFLSMLLRSDEDKDGKLSLAELPESMKQSMETTDLNADGFLDESEMQKMAESFRKRRESSRSDSRDPIVYGVAAANDWFVVRTGTRLFGLTGEVGLKGGAMP